MVSAWAKARVTRPENPRKKTADFSGNLRKLLDFKGKSMLMKNLFIWPDGVEYVFVFLNRQGELVWWCWWWWCFCLSIFLSLETWKTEAIGGGGISCLMKLECILSVKKVTKRQQPPWDRWDSNPGTCFLKCTQNLSTNDAACKITSHSWKETRMK